MKFEVSLEDRRNIEKVKSIIIKLSKEGREESLLWSAYNNFMAGVKINIELKTNINTQNEAKRTPLHMAIMGRASDIALYLIELDAKVDIQDSYRRTALHYAVKTGDLDIVKKLIHSQYKHKSTIKSFWGFMKIWNHFSNVTNLLHPIKAYNGFKLEACYEYINQKDIVGINAVKYALLLDTDNAGDIQVFLLNRDGDPDPKLGIIESAAILGLQMFIAPQLINITGKVGFFALELGARGLDIIFPNPPPPPPPNPPRLPPTNPNNDVREYRPPAMLDMGQYNLALDRTFR